MLTFKNALKKLFSRGKQTSRPLNLGAHKSSGKLDGLQSCSCGYDCHIVFSIEQNIESDDEVIVLLDIGTHDEVY